MKGAHAKQCDETCIGHSIIVYKNTQAASRNRNWASTFQEKEDATSLQLHVAIIIICLFQHLFLVTHSDLNNHKMCPWRITTVINEYLMYIRNTDNATIHLEQQQGTTTRKLEITLRCSYNFRPSLLLICFSVGCFMTLIISPIQSPLRCWGELIAYFPFIRQGPHKKKDASNNSSTIACIRWGGNVLTEPLPSNDSVIRIQTQPDSW
jgi:hypothetical protein